MTPKCTIHLYVKDEYGREVGHMAVSADEFPVFSDRFVDEVTAPAELGFSVLSFDTVVKVMKQREFRREILMDAARKLAARLSDYIEDKEGWHGERRRETIKEMESKVR